MSTVTINLPDALKDGIEEAAAREGTSIHQFLVRAADEKLAAVRSLDRLRSEAATGRREDFDRFLAAVPNAAPLEGDQLP